jgi:CrcB protein
MSVSPLAPSPAIASLSPFVQAGVVALGGAVGCLTRWRMGVWLNDLPSPIAAGTLAVLFERAPSEPMRLLLITGVLGGMTTFSAFTAESLELLLKGQAGIALMHTTAHVLGSLAAAALGWKIGRWVLA